MQGGRCHPSGMGSPSATVPVVSPAPRDQPPANGWQASGLSGRHSQPSPSPTHFCAERAQLLRGASEMVFDGAVEGRGAG